MRFACSRCGKRQAEDVECQHCGHELVQDLEDPHARHYLREHELRLIRQRQARMMAIAAAGGIAGVIASFPLEYLITGEFPEVGGFRTAGGAIVFGGLILAGLEKWLGKRRRFPYLDDYP